MRSKILRLAIACATFVAGVSVVAIYRHVRQQRLVAQANQVAVSAPAPPSSPSPGKENTYPDTLGLDPFDIESFIDRYPDAVLSPLWKRLGVSDEGDPIAHFSFSNACGLCEANSFRYDLDDDSDGEVVLQIKQGLGDSYRYLIFKTGYDNSKFLGHVDVWAKYPPKDPVVFVSNGKAWLILQSTAGTGSGLGAWLDTVYEVSNRGVRRVGSYLAEVNQSGDLGFPSKSFVGRPLSCEIKHGRAILELSYTVEYSTFGSESIDLFTKKKTAVLVQSLNNDSSYIEDESEITPHEFETIYNFDSMGPNEFLQYNRAELRAIATGNDAEKKKWLKEFLEARGQGAIKRELLALID